MTRAWWVLTGEGLSLPAAGLSGGSSPSTWVSWADRLLCLGTVNADVRGQRKASTL